jgi:hypothetical protein
MAENVQYIGRLLFGTLDWRRVLVIIAPGLIMGGVAWLIYDGALFQRSIVVLLMMDLVSGAISNATPQTNAAWRLLTRWHRWMFVVVHVCVYPLVLWQLMAPQELLWVMIIILAVKLLVFVRGALWNHA